MKVDTEKTFDGATQIELSYDGANSLSSMSDSITPTRRGVADLVVTYADNIVVSPDAVTVYGLIPQAQAFRFKILLQKLNEQCVFDFAECTEALAKLVEMRFAQRISEFPEVASNSNDLSRVKKMASPLGASVEWFEGANTASASLDLIDEIAKDLYPILCEEYESPELPFFSAHGIRLTETKETLNYVTSEGIEGVE